MSVSDPVVPPVKPSSTKTIVIASLIVVVAFLAGAMAGVFADHWMMRHGPRGHLGRAAEELMHRRLKSHLDLTDEQDKKIEEIIRRRHQRMTEIWDSVRPHVRAEIDATNAEIEKVLTPEQREKFQKMRIHLGPPGGPPPYERRGDRRRREPTR